MLRIRSIGALGAVAGLLCCLAVPAEAQFFAANNLVTDDQSANAAQITDPGLKNAWGVSFGATSPFWVSSNGAGTSTLYRVDPLTQATTKVSLVVTIPGAGNPTGQVFNSGNASGAFNGDLFLFVSEDGTVSGWRSSLGTAAETLALASSANIYKGSAFAT
ncbi:MAG: TIGR03118 family protein, partial [Betaproteobacteria bacterium]